jgi:hypothetical protein
MGDDGGAGHSSTCAGCAEEVTLACSAVWRAGDYSSILIRSPYQRLVVDPGDTQSESTEATNRQPLASAILIV